MIPKLVKRPDGWTDEEWDKFTAREISRLLEMQQKSWFNQLLCWWYGHQWSLFAFTEDRCRRCGRLPK